MAVIRSKPIPYQYTDSTGKTQSITITTEFDTTLKKTFIYREETGLLGIPTGRTLIGTQLPNDANATPFRNPETNQFNSPPQERSQFVNPIFKTAVNKATENAVRESLVLPNGPGPDSIPQKEVDNVLGKTGQSTTGNPTATQTPPIGGNPPGTQPASTQPTPSQPANPRAPSGQPVPLPENSVIGTQQTPKDGDDIRYPFDKGKDQDSVTFTAYEYQPKKLETLKSPTGTNLGNPKGTCTLAIQPSISDSNTVAWGDGRVNAIQFEAFKLARTGISENLGKAAADAGGALQKLIKDPTYGGAFTYYAAGQAAQINDVFTRSTGALLNPNLELLFQGPELRTFNFTFQLSARDDKEATMIKRVIRFFKKNMAVNKSNTDIFLKSPNVFEIKYNQDKSLNQFKTCALRSFNVDYTPLGSYMTFTDGTMVSYGLTMQFQELDPIYSQDYAAEDAIGF
jgi:hypothetical protein